MIAWAYGSGMPKSLDVSKAIDKAAGAKREDGKPGPYSARRPRAEIAAKNAYHDGVGDYGSSLVTAPATDAAKQWHGWGTALKPAIEPITVARKPLVGTVAANVMAHGTGGINVDGCRVGTDGATTRSAQTDYAESGWRTGHRVMQVDAGRWPANLIHDGSDEVLAAFPDDAGGGDKRGECSGKRKAGFGDVGADRGDSEPNATVYADSGSAARFFYCAKPSTAERGRGNNHATVKPIDLMRYLVRLVTPNGGIVLDPFAGSGTTGIACVAEGFTFIGCELSPEYAAIACRRITNESPLFAKATVVDDAHKRPPSKDGES